MINGHFRSGSRVFSLLVRCAFFFVGPSSSRRPGCAARPTSPPRLTLKARRRITPADHLRLSGCVALLAGAVMVLSPGRPAHATCTQTAAPPIARLQQELNDLKYSDVCPRPGTSSEIRRKPGSLGLFKGTDALRAENNMTRDAATAAGLNQDQAQQLHQEISGENLTYAEILELAVSIKNGN